MFLYKLTISSSSVIGERNFFCVANDVGEAEKSTKSYLISKGFYHAKIESILYLGDADINLIVNPWGNPNKKE